MIQFPKPISFSLQILVLNFSHFDYPENSSQIPHPLLSKWDIFNYIHIGNLLSMLMRKTPKDH